jgi:hypothetical protein
VVPPNSSARSRCCSLRAEVPRTRGRRPTWRSRMVWRSV